MSGEIVLKVDGLEFHADSKNDEPRVLDVSIGERVGLSRPRKIRDVIKRHIESGLLNDSDVRTVEGQSTGGRPATYYWLTETGALKVVTKLETPRAHEMVGEMVRVYRAAIHALRDKPKKKALRVDESSFRNLQTICKTVGDDSKWTREIGNLISASARHNGLTWQRIHGCLRRQLGVVSYRRIPATLLEEARFYLHKFLSGGVLLLPAPSRPKKSEDPRQLSLFARPGLVRIVEA